MILLNYEACRHRGPQGLNAVGNKNSLKTRHVDIVGGKMRSTICQTSGSPFKSRLIGMTRKDLIKYSQHRRQTMSTEQCSADSNMAVKL